jgi:nucleoside-diphosphate-sugar epimerase
MANTIAVFGGTGMTGREVVYQALNSGANVVVLARDPSKMLIPVGSGGGKGDSPLVDARLKVIKGDVTNQQDVDAVFASGDVTGVVIALGGKTKDVGPTMLTDGTSCVIEGMKKKCTSKRISIVTSIGAGDSEQQAPLMFKALMWTVMKGIFTDKNNQEKLFLSPEGPGHNLE